MRQQLEVAIRHSLAAQARNRLAWILLVAFVPGWYFLIGSMIPHRGAIFILRSNENRLVVDGHDLTLITAGLSAITLIAGFVVLRPPGGPSRSTGVSSCPGTGLRRSSRPRRPRPSPSRRRSAAMPPS